MNALLVAGIIVFAIWFERRRRLPARRPRPEPRW